MKALIIVFTSFLYFSVASANSDYDAELAESLGADDYGMKSYVLITLLTGDDSALSDEEKKKAFAGHFSNMRKMANEKKLVLAGPYVGEQAKRGLFILNTAELEVAESSVKSDPAVEAGIFTYEMSKIYSSAALMLINENHKKLAKKNPG